MKSIWLIIKRNSVNIIIFLRILNELKSSFLDLCLHNNSVQSYISLILKGNSDPFLSKRPYLCAHLLSAPLSLCISSLSAPIFVPIFSQRPYLCVYLLSAPLSLCLSSLSAPIFVPIFSQRPYLCAYLLSVPLSLCSSSLS